MWYETLDEHVLETIEINSNLLKLISQVFLERPIRR